MFNHGDRFRAKIAICPDLSIGGRGDRYCHTDHGLNVIFKTGIVERDRPIESVRISQGQMGEATGLSPGDEILHTRRRTEQGVVRMDLEVSE